MNCFDNNNIGPDELLIICYRKTSVNYNVQYNYIIIIEHANCR